MRALTLHEPCQVGFVAVVEANVRIVVGGQRRVRRLVVVQPQPHLLEVVRALDPPRGLTRSLHRREQQGDQHGDDRDHDE